MGSFVSLETSGSSNIAKKGNCVLNNNRAFEETQTVGSNLSGKHFTPTVEDFVHMGPKFVPTEGYLDHKEDLVPGRFDTALP